VSHLPTQENSDLATLASSASVLEQDYYAHSAAKEFVSEEVKTRLDGVLAAAVVATFVAVIVAVEVVE
jgi:hypothetical protein